ncbi:MAG: hydrogenase maturation nickel metallochaperone HypA [Acidobacteria bacterium]|nr:hydrogenase maturation nickel metallochaperone HypA [Acidobacteriota bacterium]
MHELSIAHSLVSLVQQQLPEGVTRVTAVDMRLGALAGVVRGALEFCYGIATEGTPLQGSTLRIVELPVVIHCPECRADRPLEGLAFRCPVCGRVSGDIRQGRELDLASIEYDDPEAASA